MEVCHFPFVPGLIIHHVVHLGDNLNIPGGDNHNCSKVHQEKPWGIKTICATDTYWLFKSLLKLFKYENSIIPVDNHIFSILYESIQNDDYSMDASELISLYYKKSGPIYSISSLFHLVDFSIETEKTRTSIWFLLIKLIFIYKYVLPSNYLNEMFKIFDQLKTIDKYLFTQIILVMLASKNHENN